MKLYPRQKMMFDYVLAYYKTYKKSPPTEVLMSYMSYDDRREVFEMYKKLIEKGYVYKKKKGQYVPIELDIPREDELIEVLRNVRRELTSIKNILKKR